MCTVENIKLVGFKNITYYCDFKLVMEIYLNKWFLEELLIKKKFYFSKIIHLIEIKIQIARIVPQTLITIL